jgi:hypothetical protein
MLAKFDDFLAGFHAVGVFVEALDIEESTDNADRKNDLVIFDNLARL